MAAVASSRARALVPRTRQGSEAVDGGGAPPFSVDATVERFQRMLQAQERSPCTVKQYGHVARSFLSHAQKPLDATNRRDLEAYREYLVLERHYSKNSLYTSIRALTCLYRSFGLDAAEGLEAPRRPERLPHYLSEEETHRLFDAVRASPRDSAIVHVLAYAGLRVGELCHLELEDIEFERNLMHIRSGKGDKDREVVIEEKTRSSLDRYLAERTLAGVGSSRLFPLQPITIERIIHKAAVAAGIPRRVTPHMLRHTLATALLSRGCDIRYIQKLLGHASVATTQIYTHVDTQALRDAYQRAKPEY